MNARKLGIGLTCVGAVTLCGSVLADWIRYSNDDALARSEGIFDFGVATHVVFFAGICLALLGALVMMFGGRVLNSPNKGLKVVAGVFAVGLIGATAAVADASKYADPSADHHADDAMSTDHHSDDAMSTDHHADDATMDHDDNNMDHGDVATDEAVEPGQVIPGTADGTSPCEIAQPAPASPGQAGAGDGGKEGQDAGEHGHRGMVKQYTLTNEERAQLIEEMRQARTVIDRYPTVADAEAAGYKRSTVFVPCIGAHYTNTSLVVRFDTAAPSELLYDGSAPESKIIGLSYLVLDTTGAPEGFAGKNDIWHQHNANGGLCLDPNLEVVGGEDISDEDCIARGGKKSGDLMEHIWMMHAWVAPGWECSWGVFAGECPELGGALGGTAHD
jgi:hypothetical protein